MKEKGGKPQKKPFADLELRSLRDYLLIIRERWLLAFTCAVLACAGVGYYLISQPTVYQADSRLMFERQGERIVDIEKVVDTGLEGSMWRALLQNHIEQLTSRNFRQYVADSLSDQERRRLVAPYHETGNGGDRPPPSVMGILGRAVEVDDVRDTSVLRVTVRHRDPEMAAFVANRYVERYIHFIMDRSHSGNFAAINFLEERAEELRNRVEEADSALQAYRENHNLVSVEDNQNIVVQRLQQVSSALTSARTERLHLDSQLEQIEYFLANERNPLEIRAIANHGSTPQLVNTLDELRKERETMGKRYGSRHPRMIENQVAMEAARELIQENIQAAVAEIRTHRQDAAAKEESLRGELAEAEQESLRLDRLSIEYQVLRRSAESARATYDQIIRRLNETAITSQLESSNVKIVDNATVPGSPVEPDLRRIILLLGFLGGALFVGIPIGLESLDNKLKSTWDIEHFLDSRLVTILPRLSRVSDEDRFHLVRNDADASAAESFHGLISQMALASRMEYPKSLLITSPLPVDGKTLIANNLAEALANHGKRVLLVDMDLRRPSLHKRHGMDNKHGVLQWIETPDAPPDPGHPALEILELAPNFSLLRSGGHTRKATEAISNQRLEELLQKLRRAYDIVIIDSPPVGVFPDALVLARHADECLYVARFNKVDRQQAKNQLERLEDTGTTVLGVVMNAVPNNNFTGYHYYGYSYSYQANQYRKYYAAAEKEG